MVQLNFTPEKEVFHMLLESSLSNFSVTSLKQHILAIIQFLLLNPAELPCNLFEVAVSYGVKRSLKSQRRGRKRH